MEIMKNKVMILLIVMLMMCTNSSMVAVEASEIASRKLGGGIGFTVAGKLAHLPPANPYRRGCSPITRCRGDMPPGA